MHYANKEISHVKSLTFYRDELWKDMFCRLVEDEAMPYHATAIQRWMQEELQIKAAMRACIQDLRRERDKVLQWCHQTIRRPTL